MKVTDYNEIKTAVFHYLTENGSQALDYLTIDQCTLAVTMIYLTNDIDYALGQDFIGNLSILSTPHRIAIIFLGHHSFYKTDGDICHYEDLESDISSIVTYLDAALARWEEQNV